MKRLLTFMALVLVAAGCSKDDAPTTPATTWDGTTVATSFANGDYTDGTSEYTIATAAQLAYLAELVNDDNDMSNKTFTLAANINLNDKDWTPIGTGDDDNDYWFKGTFDGGGHTISGLSINDSDTYFHVGLFGTVKGATIKNLSVAGSATSSKSSAMVGGVVGSSKDGIDITNCYSSVNVTGGASANVGGVVGYGENAKITNCYSSGSVEGGASAKVGGVVGSIMENSGYPHIINCYSSGSVTGGSSAKVGGVAGSAAVTTITNCYWDEEKVTDCYGYSSSLESESGNDGMTATAMQASTFVTTLNNNAYITTTTGACAWKSVSGGYPTLDFNGTPAYTIATKEQLFDFADLVNTDGNNMSGKTITLTADINLNNEPWTPIGTRTKQFKGTFDGDGYTISGLDIEGDSSNQYVGLFGYVEGTTATIKNLSVAGSVTSSKSSTVNVGGVVGYATYSTIINCHSSCSITTTGTTDIYVGGVVGYATSSAKITNCYSSGTITGHSGNSLGGVVGFTESSTITNCYSSCTFSDGTNIGGVLGYNDGNTGAVTINNCYWDKDNEAACVGLNGSTVSSSDCEGMTATEMKASTFVTKLNTKAAATSGACAWKSGTDGYPTLDFGVEPTSSI